MITAVESSVLLDVLAGPPEAAERAAGRLGLCPMEDRLIVCETVIAEVTPEAGAERVEEFLRDWHLEFVASDRPVPLPGSKSAMGGAGRTDRGIDSCRFAGTGVPPMAERRIPRSRESVSPPCNGPKSESAAVYSAPA